MGSEFEIRNSAGSASSARRSRSRAAAIVGAGIADVQPRVRSGVTWRVRAYLGNAQWPVVVERDVPRSGWRLRPRQRGIMDPLTNGRTAAPSPARCSSSRDRHPLIDHGSFVTYQLPETLQEGEMSMMILNGDEGNPGDKSKVFSMQEGPDVGISPTDDYRSTIELRGGTTAARYRPLPDHRRRRNLARRRAVPGQLQQVRALVSVAVHLADRARPVSRCARTVRAADRPCGPRPRHRQPPVSSRSRTWSTSVRRSDAAGASTPPCPEWCQNVRASSRPRPAFPGE